MHKSGHFSVTKIIFNIADKITIHLCILPFDNFGKEEKNCLQFVKSYGILLKYLGGVAHLGERLNGIQEVVGSIPIISTMIILF